MAVKVKEVRSVSSFNFNTQRNKPNFKPNEDIECKQI